MKNRYLLLSSIWFAASLYWLFFKAPSSEPLPFVHFDKVAHAGLFFVQTWLIGKIWLQARKAVPWPAILLVLFAWAGLSEVFQAVFTVDRQGELWDALADIGGILAALYFLKHSEYGQRLS